MKQNGDCLNVVITGVGGQGNILASHILASAAIADGFHTVIGETYGQSQRGGAVMSHVRLSKKEKYPGFNKYTRTTRILRMWQFNQKNAKRKAIAAKIAEKTHTSSKRIIKDTLPYIMQIFQSNKAIADNLSD